MLNRLIPVSHANPRYVELGQHRQDGLLTDRIEVRGTFVQDEHVRLAVECTGQQAALAHDVLQGGEEAEIVIVAPDLTSTPLSPAALELRNPIAPQSNYTAKTIEDDAVFAAQVVLRKNGCYDGRLDGVLADGTVYAIKLFEANFGLPVTGGLGAETQAALRASHDRFDICR